MLRSDTTSGAVWKCELEADGPWDRLNDDVVAAGSAADPDKRKRRVRRGRMSRATRKGMLVEMAKIQGIDLADRPEDLSLLIDLVRNGTPVSLQGWGLTQIAGYPAKDAVPALVRLLDHTDTLTLVQIVNALKSHSDPFAIKPLRRLLESHRNPRVKKAAAAAIESLEAEAAKLAS